MATKSPAEIPQGAIRFNTDSQKMEFFAQDQWWQMATDVPTLKVVLVEYLLVVLIQVIKI